MFDNRNNEIGFKLFKESNTIKLNNKNGGNYTNNQIEFNTQSLASKIINYSNVFIELEIEIEIPYDASDNSPRDDIPGKISMKRSFEIVKSLKIMLDNAIISNETDLNRSNLINFILNNSINDDAEYRNINKSNNDALNIVDNKFITNTNFSTGENINSSTTFKIPTFLKDINDFFRKTTLIHNGEFNINIELINNIFVADSNIDHKIKNCYLIVEEIK